MLPDTVMPCHAMCKLCASLHVAALDLENGYLDSPGVVEAAAAAAEAEPEQDAAAAEAAAAFPELAAAAAAAACHMHTRSFQKPVVCNDKAGAFIRSRCIHQEFI